MDDLRLLREMRAEVPDPGPEWLVPARARLLRRVRARHLPRFGRRLLLAGALGGAASVVIGTRPHEPGGVAPPATVRLDSATVLRQAAEVAESRPRPAVPRPDQWHYTRTLDKQANDDSGTTREGWFRYDGKQTAGYGEDGRMHVRDVPPDPGDDDLSPQQYDAKLRRLPTDPDHLLAHVSGDRHWIDLPVEEGVKKNVEPPDARAFRVIFLYLERHVVMPPKLEGAMFRALMQIPRVVVDKDVADAAGRRGLGIRFDWGGDPGTLSYHILDPRTYRYLGSRMVWLRDQYIGGNPEPAFRAGSVWATALLASGIVDRPGLRL
ncbi:CU044_5270 family protein [Microbispora sp. NPDC004025]